MVDEFDALQIEHPAPNRKAVGSWALMLPLFGSVFVWGIHFLLNVTLAIGKCFSAYGAPMSPVAREGGVWTALLINNFVTVVILVAATVLSLRNWNVAGGEKNQRHSLLLDIGEGRTSFLAHWGILVSGGFLIVTIFDSIVIFLVPLCG